MEKLWAPAGRRRLRRARPLLRRGGAWTAVAGAAVLAAAGVWLRLPRDAASPGAPPRPAAGPALGTGPAEPAGCLAPASRAGEAAANASTLATAAWAPSGPPERGWAAYAPLAAREVGTACPPATPRFAAALARWRASHELGGDGAMDAVALRTMVTGWLLRRPFLQAARAGACPPAPDPSTLAAARPDETLGGKPVLALPAALDAWRRLRAAARAELPGAVADAGLLAVASGFRGPQEEAARCADGGCGTAARARCSAHRTGTAFDLILDTRPGARPLSTAQANREALVRAPAYLWLVANADRFGFLPYAYEPWHWEWAGVSRAPAPSSADPAPAGPPPSP